MREAVGNSGRRLQLKILIVMIIHFTFEITAKYLIEHRCAPRLYHTGEGTSLNKPLIIAYSPGKFFTQTACLS